MRLFHHVLFPIALINGEKNAASVLAPWQTLVVASSLGAPILEDIIAIDAEHAIPLMMTLLARCALQLHEAQGLEERCRSLLTRVALESAHLGANVARTVAVMLSAHPVMRWMALNYSSDDSTLHVVIGGKV